MLSAIRKIVRLPHVVTHSPTHTTEPYRVTCLCGHPVSGFRKTSYQVVDCPECGQDVFVLGFGTYQSTDQVPEKPSVRVWPRWWYYSVGIAVGMLVGLFAASLFLLPQSKVTPISDHTENSETNTISPEELSKKVRTELANGNFSLARHLIETNKKHLPTNLTKKQRRDWNQLHKETALYSDLLDVSTEELVRSAANCAEEEWKLRFSQRYRGKAVLFRTTLRRTAKNDRRIDYLMFHRGKPVQIAVSQLSLFDDLDLDMPQEVIFGARIQSVTNTRQGWTVLFQSDSGVFLTEPEPLAFVSPFADEETVHSILARQKSHFSLAK